MTMSFSKASEDLWHSLGLESPTPIDGVLGLEVSEQVIHVTEQPSGYLLMFGHLEALPPDDEQTILQENLFDENPNRPIAARAILDGSWIFWNRQTLALCDVSSMHQQLEALVDVLERRNIGLC